MKKEMKYFLVALTLLFISCGQKATTYEAKEALSKHLIERYGEEFEIGYMGRRSDGKEMWYEAEIYPSKYVGTIKERDKYYIESGTVNVEKGIFGEKLGKAGDTYGIVKINESAEEFYEEKLKELFGDNVLQVYDIWFNRILENYSFENIIKVSDEERTALIIKGGIYIFGRVENDEDREWYRKQIYEFIQFMKETGTFEYVAIAINILDDRVLSKEFQENKELKQELITLGKKLDKNNHELFRIKRRELIKKLPLKLEQEVKMEKINKTEIKNSVKWSHYNNLLSLPLYSEKYIKANSLQDIRRISKFEKIEDVQFTYEDY
ncbi:hypothetical protein [Fusobacterium ulcerans]|uniref:hypothetical protein n=1 Tax=Fusobacterium ulcerans TaxID=861 RepID=UPI001D0AF730|nr:hypothetical protein [Fusobacterium ulcerans]MCB8564165.1 hypothetical protein [Fusobacterium ulcerans]MCB8648494.1 hypothetical protein [Fusobacterium ulcerans]